MSDNQELKDQQLFGLGLLRFESEVIELRIPGTKKGTLSGYFNDHEALTEAAAPYNGNANIFVTLNPVNPALLARANNRLMSRAKLVTKDEDIERHNWVAVNINPVCPEGIPSTNEEHEAAIEAARRIRDDLRGEGWPEPVLTDTGNGAQLLFYTDLSNDQECSDIIKDALIALHQKNSDEQVKVETDVFKPAVLLRLFGTVHLTGDKTEDRPHRLSQILEYPEELTPVSIEQLKQLASLADKAVGNTKNDGVVDEETQTDLLIRLGSEAQFFKDDIDEAYAALIVKGHMETWKVKSKQFLMWLTKRYYEETGKAPASDSMRQAKGVMEMKAMFEGQQRKLNLRVAELEGAVYYDLADKDWRVVKVTPGKCELLDSPPILFVRNKNLRAQVEPDFNGDVKLLLNHVVFKNLEDQILYLVNIVACFLPTIPHPVQVLHGEKGASKTTTQRMSRAIVDPAERDLLIMPNSMQDLALTLANNYMPCFDNLDGFSSEKSDLLCTACTGGSFSRRMLFTDDDEAILSFKRCISLNGINVVVTKADLIDRAILLELERISEDNRKEETEVWRAFEEDKPQIVGGALMTLAKAMAIYPKVKLDKLGRMADFTRWSYAIAEAMGLGGEQFLDAYLNNQNRSNEEAVSSNPVAAAMVALMKSTEKWEGSVAKLLGALQRVADKERINTYVKTWPKAAHILSRRLKEVQSNLKQAGIVFQIRHDGDAKVVTIHKTDTSANPSIHYTEVEHYMELGLDDD